MTEEQEAELSYLRGSNVAFDWRSAVRNYGLLAQSSANHYPTGEAAILRDVAEWAAELLETADAHPPVEAHCPVYAALPYSVDDVRTSFRGNREMGD